MSDPPVQTPGVFRDVTRGAERPAVVIGATASGKSDVAVELAKRSGGWIMSADSMQVYRGMDIGTAKPTAGDRASVPHFGLDLADPSELFTVARFVAEADRVIADAASRRVPLLIVGGTPLYHKALFQGMFEGPGEDAALRQRLRDEPPEALHARLRSIDPAAADRIHVHDAKRLVRAVEVYEVTGRPISQHQEQWGDNARPRHEAVWFGIAWERAALNRRINARVGAMLEEGWVEEVRGLLARYGTLGRNAAAAAGYAEIVDHLAGRLSITEAAERIKIRTRQLARRQTKWFRRFPGVTWLPGDASPEQNADSLLRTWHAATAGDRS